MEYKNNDFVLTVKDNSRETEAIVQKYDAFLEAITTEKYGHLRDAIREAVRFLVSSKYKTIDVLAREHYEENSKMQDKYTDVNAYLAKFPIKGIKSASIDLATGTGKSWVIYGVAQIMLAEGFVDKVLVLCPSLTIEEGLKEKFLEISGNTRVSKILQELGAIYPTPEIKSANDPILPGDICVENIHAVYERTGSSIRDSFLDKGSRTLVISDEAHHIFSPNPDDTGLRRWYEFITNEDFKFAYHIGLTGTPYIRNADDDYFHDVIYRYGLKQAMEDGIVKTIDYVLKRAFDGCETEYEETYANHKRLKKDYDGVLKPITIVITAKIVECIEEWRKIVNYIAKKERLSLDKAAKRVIWVTSGVPSNTNEKERALAALELPNNVSPEKVRKENIQCLKLVDEPDNPVEYIVSVAMLTEGWDVKNVFQIVPHSNKAFDSKLLISQVLGRGLRIPNGLTPPVEVIINNHEKWTEAIGNLYKEVLEIENKVAWGCCEKRSNYLFPLHTLEYKEEQYAVESKKRGAKEPVIRVLHPQSEIKNQRVEYSRTGFINYDVSVQGNIKIDEAARQIKLFLKEKDIELSEKWSVHKIEMFIHKTIKDRLGHDYDYVSADNLMTFKQSFGPMFRDLGKEVPRMKLLPGSLQDIKISDMPKQSFSEDAVKNYGCLFYANDFVSNLDGPDKAVIEKYIKGRSQVSSTAVIPGTEYLMEHFYPVKESVLITPLSCIYVSYTPEISFVKKILEDSVLFQSFIKSPDKGFYSIPYSYKPTEEGSTHIKRSSFNPDFFILIKDKKDILVVETKEDGDNSQENRAKYRDSRNHFSDLNNELKQNGVEWRYYMYFLSPIDYSNYFDAIRQKRYKEFKSELMQLLESKA